MHSEWSVVSYTIDAAAQRPPGGRLARRQLTALPVPLAASELRHCATHRSASTTGAELADEPDPARRRRGHSVDPACTFT